MQNTDAPRIDTPFTRQLGIDYPIIAGAMYPCSNPELVAAASAAGGIGIVQPISLTYVHGYDFRQGLRLIKSLTDRPVVMNALIEQSSKKYRHRMQQWIDIALQEGVRFFVTSLGKPGWVVRQVHETNAIVYHDATEAKWAAKGLDDGVDGIIAVNNRAGGHAGKFDSDSLFKQLVDFKVPIICAGGIGSATDFVKALETGYAGIQMGTRFIASHECNASDAYKQAIIAANESDIVLSERITGIPVSVINTPYIQNTGLQAGKIASWMLRSNKSKHLIRTLYALKSLYQLKHASQDTSGNRDYWQAGKSVAGIDNIESVDAIIKHYADTWMNRH